MNNSRFFLLSFVFALFAMSFSSSEFKKPSIYDYKVKDILGNDVKLSNYKGQVLLIVNVASKCSRVNQYKELQALYDEYADQGLEVLGFPANNFMNQEPGTNDEINTFCTQKYGVTFSMFSKISVKGKDMHPLYEFLTKKEKNGRLNAPVKWNFQKYLIDRQGRLVASFKPGQKVSNSKVLRQIKKQLKN
jgi:glutathione peroxidase